MTKRAINLRLDDDLVKAADALAAAIGTDRTDLVARGLRRELLHGGEREFIYVLTDAENCVRYVGRSCNPYQRFKAHLTEARAGGKAAKDIWIRGLLAADTAPQLVIIDDAAPADVSEREVEWIAHFKDAGKLTNGNRGGVVQPRIKSPAFVQKCIRIPADLHALIEQEAERRGDPWTFSSVAVNAMRAGLSDGHSHNPQHNTTPESLRAKRAVTTKPYESAAEAAAAGFKRKPPTAREGPTEARPKGKKG